MQSACHLKISIEQQAALRIGQCARGTPRVAKKLLRHVRDFAQVQHITQIKIDLVDRALTFLGIDDDGLLSVDDMLLKKMVEHFNGGPFGLETLGLTHW